MKKPQSKSGACRSPTYASWIRHQACAFCDHPAPSEHHHFPGRGRSGATNDLCSLPVCHLCHLRCGGQTVVDPANGERMGPIDEPMQEAFALGYFRRFFFTASQSDVAKVYEDLMKWRTSLVWIDW